MVAVSLCRYGQTFRLEKYFVVLILVLSFTSCTRPQAAEAEKKTPPPAKVENAVKETELATIKLSPQAEQRLGITTTAAAIERIAPAREFPGEILLPPDRATLVSAPIGGTLAGDTSPPAIGTFVRKGQTLFRLTPYLAPERDLRVQLDREMANAQTRLDAARVRFNRAEQLLHDRAGSEKAVQQAREELDLAENDLRTARERQQRFEKAPVSADVSITIAAPRDGTLQKVLVNSGQAVASGAPLFEIANLGSVWIRVPIYVGELNRIDRRQTARVRALNDAPGAITRLARPVNAPPTADPVANTADLYFELPNNDNALRPGQKLSVLLSERGIEESLVIPWSAVLHDINGGTWVYENTGSQLYARRRVEVRRVLDSRAILTRGPAPGAKVVATGAAELFGTEFGTGK